MTTQSEAAKKAWVTRRANAKINALSFINKSPAVKAWETRRRNVLIEKAILDGKDPNRVMAALKAWETRRAA